MDSALSRTGALSSLRNRDHSSLTSALSILLFWLNSSTSVVSLLTFHASGFVVLVYTVIPKEVWLIDGNIRFSSVFFFLCFLFFFLTLKKFHSGAVTVVLFLVYREAEVRLVTGGHRRPQLH